MTPKTAGYVTFEFFFNQLCKNPIAQCRAQYCWLQCSGTDMVIKVCPVL